MESLATRARTLREVSRIWSDTSGISKMENFKSLIIEIRDEKVYPKALRMATWCFRMRLSFSTIPTGYWVPEFERSIAWNDPAIGIQWPIQGEPSLFAQDQQAKSLAEAEHFA